MVNMKQKLLKIFFLDLTYFLLLTIILILTRIKVSEFLTQVQNYGTQLNAIDINQDLQFTQNLLSQISSAANKAYVFLFILVPIIIFILYIIFQGLTFKKEKFSYKNFILISLIPFIFLLLTLFFFKIYLFILFIITSYLAFVLYFYNIKKLKLAFFKIYKLFPFYLIYLILPTLVIGFFYLSYTRVYINVDFIWMFLIGILFTLLFSFYKNYLIKSLD